ncbi:MAG TPA: sulfite exporter TauE/SafE family protein [Nocardioidaceae bacterium]|nr:sulfite exporter TauE/SafE family protein [Nocardioidaceae bacterium]
MDAGVVAVLATTLVLAATVQGLVGLGLALVTAPVVTLLEPQLMPEFMLWLGMMMPAVTLMREHHEIDWRGLGWSLPLRIVGTYFGVLLVATFPPAGLGIAVGVMVLLSVLLTVRAVEIPVNTGTLATAGFISGVTGTATSIGGPPMAVLYQHRPPHQIRSTLGVFFILGAALSLIGLGLAGELEATTFYLALAMVPALVIGFLVSRFLNRRVPHHQIRTGVLLVSGLSAVVVLVRSLVTL